MRISIFQSLLFENEAYSIFTTFMRKLTAISLCFKNEAFRIIISIFPDMSNTPELSRVVFTLGRIESDGDRKRKWVYGR